MSNPLERQVAGDHYKTLKIQPVEFAMRAGLDACAFSILKYVSRHTTKNGRQDVEEALHFCELRQALVEPVMPLRKPEWPCSLQDYCRANNLGEYETIVLIELEAWLETEIRDYGRRTENAIRELLLNTYPTEN